MLFELLKPSSGIQKHVLYIKKSCSNNFGMVEMRLTNCLGIPVKLYVDFSIQGLLDPRRSYSGVMPPSGCVRSEEDEADKAEAAGLRWRLSGVRRSAVIDHRDRSPPPRRTEP